ncbi:MAG: helix-turn-helix transcriptional regulator [Clostridia bacterium]|nr:helix-turn-helix transcriptional regulator [Clostridia bacterium]
MNSNLINTKIIESYIRENNLTKTEFCRQCKISTSTYYRIINGKDFQLIALFKIAKTMDLKPYQFFE